MLPGRHDGMNDEGHPKVAAADTMFKPAPGGPARHWNARIVHKRYGRWPVAAISSRMAVAEAKPGACGVLASPFIVRAPMALMRWQKNEVFGVIQDAGLDPREFAWEEDDGLLRHKPTGYWFRFETTREGSPAHSPGVNERIEPHYPGLWSAQVQTVPEWLRALRREITEPDLWGELEREQKAVAELQPVENTPFTPEERERIARQLGEVKEYVRKTHELSSNQFRELESRIDYLIEAADRLPRVDWRNALVGVLLSTVVEAILPGNVVRDVIGLTLRGLGQMLGIDPTPELPY
jgi:hypothetical protein